MKEFWKSVKNWCTTFLAHSVYCACLYVVCDLPRSRGRTYRTCQEVRRHWALWHSSLHCITTNLRRCMSWMRLTQHSTSRMCPLLPTTSRSSVCFCRVCLLAWMLFSCECWMLKTHQEAPWGHRFIESCHQINICDFVTLLRNIRYDSVYLRCSKKLTGSQLSLLPRGCCPSNYLCSSLVFWNIFSSVWNFLARNSVLPI